MTPALPVAAAPVNLAEAIQGKPRGVRWRNYLIVGTVILVLSLGGAYWWRQTVKARYLQLAGALPVDVRKAFSEALS